MAKYTLGLEEDYNYELIGICTHQKDYRICWSINEYLHLRLEKSLTPFMVSGKKGEVRSSHSLYEWYDEEDGMDYHLIKNKDMKHNVFLVPEKAQIDYFLIIREANVIDLTRFLTQLKALNEVIAAYVFNPNELKSASRLIFE